MAQVRKRGGGYRAHNLKAWDDGLWVATVAYDFNPLSMVNRATHYHAVYLRPIWATARPRGGCIGKQIFSEPQKRLVG